ncbi:MAG: Lrp/AsnC family transcriptional regulator [Candidatus Thorarchaeota archaeon]
MITAFVSISVTPGEDERIVRVLIKNPIVHEAWLTIGEFDVLLILKAKDSEEVNRFVNEEVRSIEGVNRAVVTFAIQSITDAG